MASETRGEALVAERPIETVRVQTSPWHTVAIAVENRAIQPSSIKASSLDHYTDLHRQHRKVQVALLNHFISVVECHIPSLGCSCEAEEASRLAMGVIWQAKKEASEGQNGKRQRPGIRRGCSAPTCAGRSRAL